MSSKGRFLKGAQRTSSTAHEVLSKWLAVWPWRQANLLQIVAASFTRCVTPDKAGSLSGPQFLHPWGGSELFHSHVVRFRCANMWGMIKMASGTQQIPSRPAVIVNREALA